MFAPLTLLLSCSEEDTAPSTSEPGDTVDETRPDGAGDWTDPGSSGDPATMPGLSFDGPRPTNVLMISIDTTRRESLGRFSGLDDSPVLDALMQGGVVLEDHRSCSNWTYASVICAQSGSRDVELGFIPSMEEYAALLPDDVLLAAGRLAERGYASALVTTNPFFSDNFDTARGFDAVELYAGAPADEITPVALRLLEDVSADGGPCYLHAHYFDPHAPYAPPGEYLDELDALPPVPFDLDTDDGHNLTMRAWEGLSDEERALLMEHLQVQYRGEIRFVDSEIGRLLDEAESLGLLEDTLVVFWTDHGEQLSEHGEVGHVKGLYEEENRSTVAFVAPGLAPMTWSGRTAHEDLWSTILDTLGFTPGDDVTGHVLGARTPEMPRYGLRYTGGSSLQFVERDGAKLTYWWETEEMALHRTDDDPNEQMDLLSEEIEVTTSLRALMAEELERILAIHPAFALDLAEEGP